MGASTEETGTEVLRRQVRSWSPPGFTAVNRGYFPDPPPLERWEALLGAEHSVAHQLVLTAASSPLLRQLLRIPARLAEPVGASVSAREQRVADVQQTRLSRLLRRLGGAAPTTPPRPPGAPGERPRPGPLVDREIDAALSFLRNMPFEELQERGTQLHPNHFHWPLNDLRFLRENPQLWLRKEIPRCIDWDLDAQVELIGRIRGYGEELEDVAVEPADTPGEYVWGGGPFSGFDACSYYGLVRTCSQGAWWKWEWDGRASSCVERSIEMTNQHG